MERDGPSHVGELVRRHRIAAALSQEALAERAGLSGVTAQDVARSMVTATSSSRFVVPNYWPDPKTGIGYQVQVEIPYQAMNSVSEVESMPPIL